MVGEKLRPWQGDQPWRMGNYLHLHLTTYFRTSQRLGSSRGEVTNMGKLRNVRKSPSLGNYFVFDLQLHKINNVCTFE